MRLRGRLADVTERLRESYWLVPGLLALAGFAAAAGLVYVDAALGRGWLAGLDWFYASRPSGARQVLSAIAGSTITVAGVVFSVTLAATTYASGQYGPQLLTNFSRDRGNQVTLGVFVGTYLYCLVVLRTIRSAEEASADTGGAVREAFVPDLAVFGAMALAFASIGMLIYFVHHVTDSIHIDNVVARIGRGLLADVAERGGAKRSGQAGAARTPVPTAQDGRPCAARGTGYVRLIDEEGLLRLADRDGLTIRMLVRPGEFVRRGQAVALVRGGGDEARDRCRDAVTIGRRRSAAQDLSFAIDELVQIAARALSPGVNDPFTACSCVDWLGAAVAAVETAPEPSDTLGSGERGRVLIPRRRFADLFDSAFTQLRAYAARDRKTSSHLLRTLERLAADAQSPDHRRSIEREADDLRAETAERGT